MAPVLDYWLECTGRQSSTGIPLLSQDEIEGLQRKGHLEHGEKYGSNFVAQARLMPLVRKPAPYDGPLYIYHGSKDTVVPLSTSIYFMRRNPHAELRQIADADHGFAVLGDDEMSDPQTKRNHQEVYRLLLQDLLATTTAQ